MSIPDIGDEAKNEILNKIDQLWEDVLDYEPYIIAGLAGAGGVMLLTLLLIFIVMIMQCVLMSKVNNVQRFQKMSEDMPRNTPNGAVPNRFRSDSSVKY